MINKQKNLKFKSCRLQDVAVLLALIVTLIELFVFIIVSEEDVDLILSKPIAYMTINPMTATNINPIKHINNLSVYIYLFQNYTILPRKIFQISSCSFEGRLRIFDSVVHSI